MKKVILSSIICVFISGVVYSQEAVFSVILSKGNNQLSNGKGHQGLRIGAKLYSSDYILLERGGYAALVHEQSGASIEVSDEGRHQVTDLENRLRKQPTTVLAKYGRFLMKRLNPDDEGNQNLNVTGAVERGDIGLLAVDLPKVNDLFGDDLYISWKQADDIQDYVVTIKDKLDEVIVEKPVTGTSIVMDLNDPRLKKEKMIIFSVHAQQNEELRSPDFGIKRLDDKSSRLIGNELANLKLVANSENAVDNLLIASFFEENQLIADAIAYYQEAKSMSPDTDGINKLYENFLLRNGLRN